MKKEPQSPKATKATKPLNLIPTKPEEFSLFGVGSIKNGRLTVSLAQITAKNAFTIGDMDISNFRGFTK